jgi:hypothetical protein
MKNLRNFMVLFSIVLGAMAANAQPALHGKFQLTSETRWSKAVLPAGDYTFTIDSVESPVIVVIRAVNGKGAVMAMALTSDNAAPGGSSILITADHQVRSMNLPQLGMSLVFNRLTSRERETLYASASHTVPIQLAQK